MDIQREDTVVSCRDKQATQAVLPQVIDGLSGEENREIMASDRIEGQALQRSYPEAVMAVDKQGSDLIGGKGLTVSSWTTSNKKVARIDSSGLLTAVAEGTAEITAVVEGHTYSCTVTIEKPRND